jgi:hypothetical protein
MNKNKVFVSGIIVFVIVLGGCLKNKKLSAEEKYSEETIIDERSAAIDKSNIIVKNNITQFFFYEILNGDKNLSSTDGEDGVINFFGDPISENKIPVSFIFEGGKIIEIYELVYEDLVHRYYVSESGHKLYEGFFVKKKLDRLISINIDDTSEKLLSTFVDKYYTWTEYENIKENISYYTDPVVCEIQFVIKNNVIEMIWCNFLLLTRQYYIVYNKWLT